MNGRVTSGDCCVRAWGLDSLSLAEVCGCPKRFFWLRGGKRDAVLGLLILREEGTDISFQGA